MIQYHDIGELEENAITYENCDAICFFGEDDYESAVGNFEKREKNKILNWVKQNFSATKFCPYCNYRLITCDTKWSLPPNMEGEDISEKFPLNQETGVWVCLNCTFWQSKIEENHPNGACMGPGPELFRVGMFFGSKLKNFNPLLPEGIQGEIASHLRRNQKAWHLIPPKKFEEFIVDIFRANYKDADVMHVGKPKDDGIDIIFINSENQEWVIQVKQKMAHDGKVRLGVIRELLGAMLLKNSKYGAVVSPVSHFTTRAYEYTKIMEKKGYIIELIDKGKLNRMLNPMLHIGAPWEEYLNTYSEETAADIIKYIRHQKYHKSKQLSSIRDELNF